jgi:ribosome-binding factor A
MLQKCLNNSLVMYVNRMRVSVVPDLEHARVYILKQFLS